ncbi:MAG: ASCH domain-containing protein [Bacteroidota bacterium]|nr:ASCH domain-containing protein [Bacteroidota bacterium]
MKALSLLQPWASLVVMGVKNIETRSWQTQHRGNLLIHASQGKAGSIFATELPFTKYITDFKKLPFGAIIGVATLTDIVRTEELFLNDAEMNKLTMEEKAFGDYTSGRYAWMLKSPIAFNNPIPARGTLSLWEYELNLV